MKKETYTADEVFEALRMLDKKFDAAKDDLTNIGRCRAYVFIMRNNAALGKELVDDGFRKLMERGV